MSPTWEPESQLVESSSLFSMSTLTGSWSEEPGPDIKDSHMNILTVIFIARPNAHVPSQQCFKPTENKELIAEPCLVQKIQIQLQNQLF